MGALIKLKSFESLALFYPWIFLPVLIPRYTLFGIIFFSILTICIYIFTVKEILFYENWLLVRKYRSFFLRSSKKAYGNIEYIFIFDGQSISKSPVLSVFFRDKKKEIIVIPRHKIKSLVELLTSRKIVIKSNRNELLVR